MVLIGRPALMVSPARRCQASTGARPETGDSGQAQRVCERYMAYQPRRYAITLAALWRTKSQRPKAPIEMSCKTTARISRYDRYPGAESLPRPPACRALAARHSRPAQASPGSSTSPSAERCSSPPLAWCSRPAAALFASPLAPSIMTAPGFRGRLSSLSGRTVVSSVRGVRLVRLGDGAPGRPRLDLVER